MNLNDVYALLIILESGAGMLAGFCFGYIQAQRKYIPKIIKSNYELTKLKMLASLNTLQPHTSKSASSEVVSPVDKELCSNTFQQVSHIILKQPVSRDYPLNATSRLLGNLIFSFITNLFECLIH